MERSSGGWLTTKTICQFSRTDEEKELIYFFHQGSEVRRVRLRDLKIASDKEYMMRGRKKRSIMMMRSTYSQAGFSFWGRFKFCYR